jgi:putative transposase
MVAGMYLSRQKSMFLMPIHVSTSAIGIDRGVKIFAMGSDNTEINFNSNIDKYYNQLKFEQRKLARKKKFSSNWTKQKDKISKMHNKIANIRNDFLHKESTKLSKNHAVIVLEKLKIKNMSKSAKGTISCNLCKPEEHFYNLFSLWAHQ